jgi:hypothetical protein
MVKRGSLYSPQIVRLMASRVNGYTPSRTIRGHLATLRACRGPAPRRFVRGKNFLILRAKPLGVIMVMQDMSHFNV